MKKMILFRTISVAFLMLSFIACIKQPELQNRVPQLPVIEEFSGNMARSYITPCELKWRVTGASDISIDKGIGKVDSNGSRSASISQDTIFTLTAINEMGTVSKQTAVFVHIYPYRPGIPDMQGYSKYVDDINDIVLTYPTSWIIERRHCSGPDGTISGVLISNGKPGSDYAYYDVEVVVKELTFDKRAFADQYREEKLAKGYTLICDKTMHIAGDGKAIMQMYNRICDNRSYDHGAIFRFWDYDKYGKLWVETFEWPHNQTEYNIPNCFSHCRLCKSFN